MNNTTTDTTDEDLDGVCAGCGELTDNPEGMCDDCQYWADEYWTPHDDAHGVSLRDAWRADPTTLIIL